MDAALSTTSTNAIQNKAVANALNEKADASALASKQDTLVSGTNIKTVQGQSILGSGNISISVPTVDAELSSTSTNAVQNKVVKAAIDKKQDGISDLETIRSGAAKGTTAVQPEVISNQIANLYSVLYEGNVDVSSYNDAVIYQSAEGKTAITINADGLTSGYIYSFYAYFSDGSYVNLASGLNWSNGTHFLFAEFDKPVARFAALLKNSKSGDKVFASVAVLQEGIDDNSITSDKIASDSITTEKLADNAVTIDKTDFVEIRGGNQLYNELTMGVAKSWYYFVSDSGVGKEVSLQANQYTGGYTAIKIPVNGISNATISQQGGRIYAWFAVKKDMTAIDYKTGLSDDISNGFSVSLPNDTAYLLLDILSYNSSLFMVNEGIAPLPFESFKPRIFIDGVEVSETDPALSYPDIYLPKTIYAVVGDTLQLFYRGMIQGYNPELYNILVTCTKGQQYPRYFEYTPSASDVGTFSFKVSLRDVRGKVVASKACSIVVSSSPISPKSNLKVMCFGDSLTNGTWCYEAMRRLKGGELSSMPTGNGLTNIDFVGSMNKDGAGYFGQGGWSWSNYITAGSAAFRFFVSNVSSLTIGATYTNNGYTYKITEVNITNGTGNILCTTSTPSNVPASSGTLTKSSGSGDASIQFSSSVADAENPLWDSSSNKMSFIPYANEVSEGRIDVVYVLLGWNGLSAWKEDFSLQSDYINTFANTLHSEFPSAKLKLVGIQLPSITGGMGANYGATGTSYADEKGIAYAATKINELYQQFANEHSSFVEYVDTACQFDIEYNMPYAMTKVNTRNNITEKRGTNGVHPSLEGFYQIADAVYRNIVANYCQGV